MKYICVFDDSVLDDFENSLDRDGIFIKLMNKRKKEITFRITPLIYPTITVDEETGSDKLHILYLTEGHIDALRKYEREQTMKMFVERFKNDLDEVKNITFRKGDNNGQ